MHRKRGTVKAVFLENTPNFRCWLHAEDSGRDAAQNTMTSAMIRDGEQQKSKAAHTGKHTQPFSTVSSWGQYDPSCLRTLYYNLPPLMQPSPSESKVCLLSTIHPSPHPVHRETTSFQNGKAEELGAESFDLPRLTLEHIVPPCLLD